MLCPLITQRTTSIQLVSSGVPKSPGRSVQQSGSLRGQTARRCSRYPSPSSSRSAAPAASLLPYPPHSLLFSPAQIIMFIERNKTPMLGVVTSSRLCRVALSTQPTSSHNIHVSEPAKTKLGLQSEGSGGVYRPCFRYGGGSSLIGRWVRLEARLNKAFLLVLRSLDRCRTSRFYIGDVVHLPGIDHCYP